MHGKLIAEGIHSKLIADWLEKIKWQCYPRASERACVTFPPIFGQGQIMQNISHDTLL